MSALISAIAIRPISLIASAAVFGASFLALVLLLAGDDCDIPGPDWLPVAVAALVTLAAVWVISELVVPRILAMPAAISSHFLLGFIGWGIANLFFPGDGLIQGGGVWVPFWLYGVVLGTDMFTGCGD